MFGLDWPVVRFIAFTFGFVVFIVVGLVISFGGFNSVGVMVLYGMALF